MFPFFAEGFDNPKQLSWHEDNVHIGLGLLRGDISKW
jgi:hypothetical protein